MEGSIERFVKDIFAECIQRHNYKVLEFETNKDHLHMLVEVANKEELSAIVRTLKAVSSKELQATPRFRVGNVQEGGYYRRKPVEVRSSFWARRYGLREIDENEIEEIREYIRNQKRIPHT